jgi:hypothetical protein
MIPQARWKEYVRGPSFQNGSVMAGGVGGTISNSSLSCGSEIVRLDFPIHPIAWM